MPSSAVRYSALPTPDVDNEMDAAFDDAGHDGHEAAQPLLPATHTPPTSSRTHPGTYDFEGADYDFPPPGSPPGPSTLAIPNTWGNSNGQLPSSSVPHPSADIQPHPNIFRRALRVVFPSQYTRVDTGRPVGGGIENDGVFANVVAKPVRPSQQSSAPGADDGIHVVPEEVQKDAPPSYQVAQADAVPPYWETTVIAPSSSAFPGEMIVENLPTGTIFSFLWSALISMSFDFIGFLLTYLLHTTHAAKYGSRAGLGMTLLRYGFALRARASQSVYQQYEDPTNPGDAPLPVPSQDGATEPDDGVYAPYTQEWASFLLMTVGWFILLTSVLGFWRVKRWERSILIAQAPSPPTREQIEEERNLRRNLATAFGFSWSPRRSRSDDEEAQLSPEARSHDERLTADFRAAGLI